MPFTKHILFCAAALAVCTWGAPRASAGIDGRRAQFSGAKQLTTDADAGASSSSSSHSALLRREVSSAGSPLDASSVKVNETGSIDTLAGVNSTRDTGAKVAICFSGLLRGLTRSPGRNYTLNENLREKFVEALGEKADIFVASPPYPGMTADTTRHLLEPLGVTELRLHEEPRVEQLWAQAYATMPADAFSVVETFGDTGGSTMFGPVFGNGFGIYQWYWRDHCLEMLEQRERAQGRKYERVIATRYDQEYLVTHPPLKMLDPQAVWIPIGQDETGLNDHHAVIPRENATTWLGMWKALLSGDVAEYLKQPTMLSSWRNPEVLLKHVAFHHKLNVKHFPPPAAVINCPGTGDFHCTFGSCNRKKYLTYKSCEEAEGVFRVIKMLEEKKGWSQDVIEHF